MNPLEIAMTVGGKFSSEQAALALQRAGHSVNVVTSLPRARFSSELSCSTVVSSELIYRIGKQLGFENGSDLLKMRVFSRSAKRKLQKNKPPDLIFGWSSFSQELFSSLPRTYKVLVRESTHIAFQDVILAEAYGRLGLRYQQRAQVMERELAEYTLADKILVCSQFAKETFIERGINENKLAVIPLGVETQVFRPRRRHAPHLPMKFLFVGSLSVRKGIVTLLEATQGLPSNLLKLTCVGPIEPELKRLLKRFRHFEWIPALPSEKIAPLMREFDAFVFPTLEDGYGSVLVQAMSSGLVPISTTCAGSAEWIVPNVHGILVPPHDVQSLRKSIVELAENRTLYERLRSDVLALRPSLDLVNYRKALCDFVQFLGI